MEFCAEDDFFSGNAEWCVRGPKGAMGQWYGKPQLLYIPAEDDSEGVLAAKFERLRTAWHSEYGLSSSFGEITRCPSYREIVRYGDRMLPFIFRDLERRPEPDFWFDALVEITKVNPVPDKDRGYSRRMAKAWLKWARANRKYG